MYAVHKTILLKYFFYLDLSVLCHCFMIRADIHHNDVWTTCKLLRVRLYSSCHPCDDDSIREEELSCTCCLFNAHIWCQSMGAATTNIQSRIKLKLNLNSGLKPAENNTVKITGSKAHSRAAIPKPNKYVIQNYKHCYSYSWLANH